MRAEVRQMLDLVDEWMVTQPYEIARDFIDIVVALRGPDLPGPLHDESLKYSSTNYVRHAALPRVVENRWVYRTGWDISLAPTRLDVDAGVRTIQGRHPGATFHFVSHIRRAFEAMDRKDGAPPGLWQ